jgi:hypothetical protein
MTKLVVPSCIGEIASIPISCLGHCMRSRGSGPLLSRS